MSETVCVPWQGYLACSSPNFVLIQDPHLVEGEVVHGPDSDYNCLVIAGLEYLKSEIENMDMVFLPESLDHSTIAAATSVKHGDGEWRVILNQDASISISRDEKIIKVNCDSTKVMELDYYNEIETAWKREMMVENVSQGAYVSEQLYRSNEETRLALSSQLKGEKTIWPPRANILQEGNLNLDKQGRVISWTSLSSAGAPSEFSIRAPVLGGITTILIEFEKGPRGVFMLCDDKDRDPDIGEEVELVVRRLYAQEGIIRYGLKARCLQ